MADEDEQSQEINKQFRAQRYYKNKKPDLPKLPVQPTPTQPPQKQETVNRTPVYAFLTVIAVLVGIVLILVGLTNGAVGGLVEADHADPAQVTVSLAGRASVSIEHSRQDLSSC